MLILIGLLFMCLGMSGINYLSCKDTTNLILITSLILTIALVLSIDLRGSLEKTPPPDKARVVGQIPLARSGLEATISRQLRWNPVFPS